MRRIAPLLSVVLCAFGPSVRGAQSPSAPEVFIAKAIPGFRLVVAGDYVNILREGRQTGQSALTADFDQDGRTDWAVLIINEQSKEVRAYYLLAALNGYKLDLLFTRTWSQASDGVVRTPMFLKPAGDSGISDRMYNSLTNDGDRTDVTSPQTVAKEREGKVAPYRAVPAVEIWTGQRSDERDTDLEDLGYCSSTWYYERGALKTFRACD